MTRARVARISIITAVVLIALLWLARPAETDESTPLTAAEVCGDCHEEYVDAAELGPHSVFEEPEWSLADAGFDVEVSCETCHGDATQHLEDEGSEGTMITFDDTVPTEAPCLSCHQDTHPRFLSSPHAQAGMSCTTCHSIHSPDPAGPPLLRAVVAAAEMAKLRGASATCYDCHMDQFAQFEFNERHRLQEGILECTSCHDPHAPATRAMLTSAAKKPCVSCHTDKEGPFVFEHGSVMGEGCTTCHSPHGSPNRHMLAHQDMGELCFSCHAEVPQFHFGFNPAAPPAFDTATNCVNCHSAIHGSNFDPFFLQ